MESWNDSLYKWSRSHDQDGLHAHIHVYMYGKNLQNIFLKLGMQHRDSSSTNDGTGQTLAYVTARSNLVAFICF